MVRPSVILSVRYRNHFPVVQFQNQHIFGILMERVTFLKPFGAPQAPPEKGRPKNPRNLGRRWRPNFFFLFYLRLRRLKPTPRPGRPRRPKYGAIMVPQIFYIYFRPFSFTAAEGGGYPNGHRRHPNGGAQGAQRWRQRLHFSGGRGKSRRKREFASMSLTYFTVF